MRSAVLFALLALSIAAAVLLWSAPAGAGGTSTGLAPINDLGAGTYLGFEGGLYENGTNAVPADHAAAGYARASAVEPLDVNGSPNASGKVVLLSVGMSNTTQEFCSGNSALPCSAWSFMGRAAADPDANGTTLALVNGAAGGQAAATWDSPVDANYDRVRDTRLTPQGLSEAQVQAVWVKVANPGPTVSLPNASADAYTLETQMGNIVRALKVRYPNVKLVFLSSRIYAGYATTSLNPEPYAYESGFAMKWLVQAQVDQQRNAGVVVDARAGDLNYNTVAPWVAWGPYLWADGTTPRSDGLTWLQSDLAADGTHPSMTGQEKAGTMLLDFFLASPFATCWFRADATPCGPVDPGLDTDGDGCADVQEIAFRGNPSNFWDFFDTPDGSNVRDHSISGPDFFRLLARFGASGDDTIDPLSAPPAAPAYHTAFDRSSVPGELAGPADGSIAGVDFFLMLAQFGMNCA